MAKLKVIAESVRSKNAGPFSLTVDIFCGSNKNLEKISKCLTPSLLSKIFLLDENKFKKFEINKLNVIKISFPRPFTQGSAKDRDLHGSSWGILFGEIEID